jgi:hypothetical protein
MMRSPGSNAHRNPVVFGALALALALTAGVAYSAIPDSNDVVHGCYDNASGALRVVDTDAGVCAAAARPRSTGTSGDRRA